MRSWLLFFLEVFSRILSRLPRKWVRRIGSLFGILWIDILRVRRKVVQENLEIAFPDLPMKVKWSWGRKSVHNLGANFLEVLTIPNLDQEWFQQNVVYEGLENLRLAHARGQGVYLLGMHLGSGDIMGNSLVMAGFPLYLITKKIKNQVLNSVWFHFRGGERVRYVDAHGERTPFEILKAIRSKALVVFVTDQFMGRPYAIETTFFGRKTGTAYGLALFYLKTRSPVIPIYSYEGQDHKLHIVCGPALELESLVGSDQDKSILALTQRFCDVTEEAIKKHPSDWMWVHRRWKEYE